MMKTDRTVFAIVAVAIVVLAALCAFKSCTVENRPGAENPVIVHDTITVVREPAPADSSDNNYKRRKKKGKSDKTEKPPAKTRQRDYPEEVVSDT